MNVFFLKQKMLINMNLKKKRFCKTKAGNLACDILIGGIFPLHTDGTV